VDWIFRANGVAGHHALSEKLSKRVGTAPTMILSGDQNRMKFK
jgi:hypothetical protein